jgi:hypothetical protein
MRLKKCVLKKCKDHTSLTIVHHDLVHHANDQHQEH